MLVLRRGSLASPAKYRHTTGSIALANDGDDDEELIFRCNAMITSISITYPRSVCQLVVWSVRHKTLSDCGANKLIGTPKGCK